MRVICAGATVRRTRLGAGTVTSSTPTPSTARSTSRLVASCAQPPARPATVSMPSPASMLRRRPMPSAISPATMPSAIEASCTSDSRNPACTSVMPRSACSAGMAGGSLPTCSAALTPARMTIHGAWGCGWDAGDMLMRRALPSTR